MFLAAIVLGANAQANASVVQFTVARVEGSDEIIRWSCGTHPVLSTGLSDAQVIQLRRALRQLSHATGIRFKYQGETRVDDVVRGAIHVRTLDFGNNQAPASTARVSHETAYVAAVVNLNPAVKLDGRYTINVLLHELGHAVGLDHVDAFDEVMSGTVLTGATAYGNGDLAGLETVGCDDPS